MNINYNRYMLTEFVNNKNIIHIVFISFIRISIKPVLSVLMSDFKRSLNFFPYYTHTFITDQSHNIVYLYCLIIIIVFLCFFFICNIHYLFIKKTFIFLFHSFIVICLLSYFNSTIVGNIDYNVINVILSI